MTPIHTTFYILNNSKSLGQIFYMAVESNNKIASHIANGMVVSFFQKFFKCLHQYGHFLYAYICATFVQGEQIENAQAF